MSEEKTKQPVVGEWEAMDWAYPQAKFTIYDDGDPHGKLAIVLPGGQLMECGGHADYATDLRRARWLCRALNVARAAAIESDKASVGDKTAFASSAWLGDAVAGVVAERDELLALTQEMLATLRVNLNRGTLRTDDDEFFKTLLNKWGGWLAPGGASPNYVLDDAPKR